VSHVRRLRHLCLFFLSFGSCSLGLMFDSDFRALTSSCVRILPTFSTCIAVLIFGVKMLTAFYTETLEELLHGKQLNLETQNLTFFFGILTPETGAACVLSMYHKERRNSGRSSVRYGLQPKALCFCYL
jgi:hypothetical protein